MMTDLWPSPSNVAPALGPTCAPMVGHPCPNIAARVANLENRTSVVCAPHPNGARKKPIKPTFHPIGAKTNLGAMLAPMPIPMAIPMERPPFVPLAHASRKHPKAGPAPRQYKKASKPSSKNAPKARSNGKEAPNPKHRAVPNALARRPRALAVPRQNGRSVRARATTSTTVSSGILIHLPTGMVRVTVKRLYPLAFSAGTTAIVSSPSKSRPHQSTRSTKHARLRPKKTPCPSRSCTPAR